MLRTQPQIGELTKLRLNITVIGETGIGKTTFLKTLFKRYCSNEAIRSILSTSTTKTVMIEKIGGFEISSGAVKCAIELTDCPGFGDFVDNRCAIRTVADFLKKGHDDWLTSNTNWVSPEKRYTLDNRIHCLFYFIAPHRIKCIDKEVIKQLNGLAPMVLVIPKADTMTLKERYEHLCDLAKMVTELSAECKYPINFDFLETDTTFLDDKCPITAAATTTSTDSDSSNHTNSTENSAQESEDSRPVSPLTQVPGDYSRHLDVISLFEDDSVAPSSVSMVGDKRRADESTVDRAEKCPTESVQEEDEVEEGPDVVLSPRSREAASNQKSSDKLPKARNFFAAVCDTSESGKREFPWGHVDIYNEEHSDFRRLQRLMMESGNITRFINQTQDMSLRILSEKLSVGIAPIAAMTSALEDHSPPHEHWKMISKIAASKRVMFALYCAVLYIIYAILLYLL